MKARKNNLRKVVNTAALVFVLINLFACGSSNQVVSNRWIQKRKYTSGWFVKSSKLNKQSKNTKAQAEQQTSEIHRTTNGTENTVVLSVKKLKPIESKQTIRIMKFAPLVVSEQKEEKGIEEALITKTPSIDALKVISHQEKKKKVQWVNRSGKQKSKRKGMDIDPWFLTAIIVVGAVILALILAIILDSLILLSIVKIAAVIICLGLIGLLIYSIIVGVGEFFDAVFDLLFLRW